MFNQVKVSVVIPIWNTEKYLEKCLESLVNQTLKEIEIICVNNGSEDSCLQILEDYRKNDDRIKIITIEHGYLSDARNVGIKTAVGEYLYCLDSDDWLELTALEKWYKQAKDKNADVVLIQENRVSDNFLRTVNVDKISLKLYGCEQDGVYTYKQMRNLFISRFCAWMHFYNRKFFLDNDLFYPSETFYEDVSIHFKTIFYANRIAVVLEPLHNYYVRGTSSYALSHSSPEKLDVIKYISEFYDILLKKNIFKLYKYEYVCWAFSEINGHMCTASPDYKQKLAKLFVEFVSTNKIIEEYVFATPCLAKNYTEIELYANCLIDDKKKKKKKKQFESMVKYVVGCICFPYYVYKIYRRLKGEKR